MTKKVQNILYFTMLIYGIIAKAVLSDMIFNPIFLLICAELISITVIYLLVNKELERKQLWKELLFIGLILTIVILKLLFFK